MQTTTLPGSPESFKTRGTNWFGFFLLSIVSPHQIFNTHQPNFHFLLSACEHDWFTQRRNDSCEFLGTKSQNLYSPLTFIMAFDVGSSYNHFTPQIMSRHGAHFHLEIKCKLAKRVVLQKHMHIDFSLISAALLGDALKSHRGKKKRERKTTICYAYSL